MYKRSYVFSDVSDSAVPISTSVGTSSAGARSGPLEEPAPSTPRLGDKTDRWLVSRESIPPILPVEDLFFMLNKLQISVLDRNGSFDSFAEARPLGGWREASRRELGEDQASKPAPDLSRSVHTRQAGAWCSW